MASRLFGPHRASIGATERTLKHAPTLCLLIARGERAFLDAQNRAFVCRFKNGGIICHADQTITIDGLADFDQHSVDECAGAISRQYQSGQPMSFIKTHLGHWCAYLRSAFLRADPCKGDAKDVAGGWIWCCLLNRSA